MQLRCRLRASRRPRGALGIGALKLRPSRPSRLVRVSRSLCVVPGPARLPRADEAVIATDKLVGYALNPVHPRGRHKARVFASALGIRQADWRYLHEQLLEGVVEAPVRGTRITPFGVLYDVDVIVDGLNASLVRLPLSGSSSAIVRRGSSPHGGHPVIGCHNRL